MTHKVIGKTVLTSSTSTISFTSIPSIYTDLRIIGALRADNGADVQDFYLRYNNDSTSNYQYLTQRLPNDTTTWGSTFVQTGDTSVRFSYCAGGNSSANVFGPVEIHISGYANTSTYTLLQSHYGQGSEGSGASVRWQGVTSAHYKTTTTVNRIDIFVSSGNFVAGSNLYLYGIS